MVGWRACAAKVTGASHLRTERCCQDAIRVEDCGGSLIVAVADGHGSDACPFSDEGAQAAVDCACELLADVVREAGGEAKRIFADTGELRLPRQLSAEWRRRIDALHGERGGEFSYTLYGTTILAAVAAEDFVFALQLGDGDILAVGETADWLLVPEYMPGNETYSLCMPDCWRYMHTCVYTGDAELIMLTTDGYANSFLSTEGFMKAGSDILGMLRSEGAELVERSLEEWLNLSSSEGSGDDISMALIYRRIDC